MNAFLAVYGRELRAYFFSPIAYVILFCFLGLTGYFFSSGVAIYAMASLQAMQNPMLASINISDALVGPLMGNQAVILLFFIPLLTMRLLAEEKRSGTLELLLSYPLTDARVVTAKFLAAWSVVGILLLIGFSHTLLLATVTDKIHWPAVAAGYLGLLLMTGSMISLGVFASALTENQIVAAVLAFALLLLSWVMGWSSAVASPELSSLLKALSPGDHFQRFPQGMIDTADLAYFVLFILFFLFISIRVVEAKRWKA